MANRSLILALSCLLATAAPGWASPTPTPPTSGITPISNGKLVTPLNANGFPITGLDLAGSGITGGGGGGGGSGLTSITGDSGSATGLTLAITHITGTNLTDPVFTLGATLSAAHGGTGFTSLSLLKAGLSLDLVNNVADLDKPISTATQTALDAKVSASALAAFTGTSNIVTLGTIATGTWSGTALVAGKVPALNGITAPTGDVSLNSHKITSLADPTGATDATNKQYVDAVSSTGPPHPAAAVASTANLTLSGEQTIDGVLTSANRILVKNQTTGSQNGIYVTAAGAWTRATDADADAEISGSVFVSGGTINGGTTWGLTTPQPVTLDTTSLAYTQTGANTIYSATGGITLSGAQFSLTTMPTLTLKGNSTGGTAAPTDITYGTLKTGLSLNNVENTALSTWAGSGNIVTLGTVTTGTIPTARIQNITTVGANFLNSLGTPGNAAWPKINSNGTITERLASETLGDIGGQAAISITNGTPLTLSPSAALSMVAATDLVPGYFSANDHQALTGKVPSSRTLSVTAPLRISTSTTPISGAPGSDWSANRTVDMLAATNGQDGYMTKEDHLLFVNKTPPDSQVAFANTGTTTTPAVWTPGATSAYETAPITTADKYAFLPPSSGYAPGKRITYTDAVTTADFGRIFRPATGSGDVINNGQPTSDYKPFIAGVYGPFARKSVEFQAVTASGAVQAGWQVVATGTAFIVQDAADAQKQFTLAATNQIPGQTGNVTAGTGETITVKSTDATLPGVLQDINLDGTVDKAQLHKVEVLPSVYEIGLVGVDIGVSSVTITDSSPGVYDKVLIMGRLIAPLTIRFVSAGNYQEGESVTVIDKSGTVSASNFVTVVPPATGVGINDTFNVLNSSFVLDEQNTSKGFTSDGAGNWSVSTAKTKVQGYGALAGPTLTVNADPNAVEVHAQFNLANGANNLNIPSPVDGQKFDFVLVQPSSSTAGTLNLPAVSRVEGGGGGLVTLSSVNSRVDTLRGRYSGTTNEFLWEAVKTNYTSIPVPSTPTSLATSGVTASNITLTWTDAATTETAYYVERCQGAACSSFDQIGSTQPAGTTTYSDASVHPATNYSYRVRCSNAGGFSAYSGTASALTSAGGPTANFYENHFDEGTGSTAIETVPIAALNTVLQYPTDWTASTQTSTGAALNLIAGVPGVPVGAVATATCPSGTCTSNWHYRVFPWKTANGLHGSTVDLPTGAAQALNLDGGHFNTITFTSVAGADEYRIYRTTVPGGGTVLGAAATTGYVGTVTQPGGGAGLTQNFLDTGLTATTAVPGNVGATDIHNATPSVSLTYGSQISVSFWMKTTFNPSSSITFVSGTSWSVAMNSNKLQVSFARAGGTTETATVSNTTIKNGSWHHIAILMDNTTPTQANSEIKVYVDGDVTSNSGNGLSTTYTSTCVSGTCGQNFAASKPIIGAYTFVGAIDDFRIYDHLLTNTATTGEIASLASGNAQ